MSKYIDNIQDILYQGEKSIKKHDLLQMWFHLVVHHVLEELSQYLYVPAEQLDEAVYTPSNSFTKYDIRQK